jgi:hypothetical protein
MAGVVEVVKACWGTCFPPHQNSFNEVRLYVDTSPSKGVYTAAFGPAFQKNSPY